MKRWFHHSLVSLYILFFLAPLSALFVQRHAIVWPLLPNVVSILLYSFVQALLSALGALFLGVGGAFGLQWLASRWRNWLWLAEGFVKAPAFVPPIFVILAILAFSAPYFHFPFGLWGVIFVHVLMNAGYVATRVRRLFEDRIGQVAEMAWLEGATRTRFLRALLPTLIPDLTLVGFVVFCVCFTSFAVPLTLGGAHGATLEVLVYERFRSGTGLGEALGYAVIQLIVLLGLGMFLFRELKISPRQWPLRHSLLESRGAVPLAFLPTLILVMGLLQGLPEGVRQLQHYGFDLPILWWTMGSFSVGLTVGLGVLFFVLLALWLMPHAILRGFLLGFGQPSTALFGLSLVLIGSALPWMVYVKVVVGLVLILTPIVFRWILIGPLLGLNEQLTMAELLGASRRQIFQHILFPQVIEPLAQAAAFASVWAACDFSLSSFVGEGEWTLALGIDNLLSNYREELATGLIWWLLLVASVCYGIFVGIGYGLDRKFKT